MTFKPEPGKCSALRAPVSLCGATIDELQRERRFRGAAYRATVHDFAKLREMLGEMYARMSELESITPDINAELRAFARELGALARSYDHERD